MTMEVLLYLVVMALTALSMAQYWMIEQLGRELETLRCMEKDNGRTEVLARRGEPRHR